MMMKKYLLAAGIVAATVSLSVAKPAAALSFDYNAETVTIDTATDQGQSFGIFFNGLVENTLVAGLTSEAKFTISSITSKALTFMVNITNTSSAPITSSRVSILGFNVDPNPGNGNAT